MNLAVAAPLALLLNLNQAQAPNLTGNEIWNRVLGAFSKVKTWQGTIKASSQTEGVKSVAILEYKMQCDGDGKTLAGLGVASITTTEGKTTISRHGQILDDGKNLYTIDDDQKSYMVSEHRSDDVLSIFGPTLDAVRRAGVLSTTITSIGGKSVYVLAGKSEREEVEIRVDRNSMLLNSIRITSQNGLRKAMELTELSNQVFDAQFPANTFRWVSPKGYTKSNNESP